jgi:hypothetical protein
LHGENASKVNFIQFISTHIEQNTVNTTICYVEIHAETGAKVCAMAGTTSCNQKRHGKKTVES